MQLLAQFQSLYLYTYIDDNESTVHKLLKETFSELNPLLSILKP